MKGYLFTIAIILSVSFFSNAQTVRDDGKISIREQRFVQHNIYGSDRNVRLKEWKNKKLQQKMNAKNLRRNRKTFRQVNANKKYWGTKRNKEAHAKHNKAMKKGWFARSNPKQHEPETNRP